MQGQQLLRFSAALVAAGLMLLPGSSWSAQELMDMQNTPGQWGLPGKDYALTRYSELRPN